MADKNMQFYKKRLDGLTILFEKRDLPIISVALAAKFGSAFDSEKEKGISHFIEHMLLKGTKSRTAKQISESIESKGGEYNAFTSKTLTAVWMKLPSKHLKFSIELLADIFKNSVFDEKETEKERKAILEEIKMYHDTPNRHVFEEISKLMYKSPFGISGLGTQKSVQKISRNELIKKYKERFSGNFVLVVIGNAEFKNIIKLAEKLFKKSQKIEENYDIIKISGNKEEKRKDIDQAHISVGFHFPSLAEKPRYAAEIFHSIFSSDSSSRIFQEIREKRGLAYAVLGVLEQEKSHGEEIIYIGTKKEKVYLVKKIILSEFKKMKKLSNKEIEKTKQKLISSRILSLEDSRTAMLNLLIEEVCKNGEEYYKYEKRIKSVKPDEVRKLAKLEKYSAFSLIPE